MRKVSMLFGKIPVYATDQPKSLDAWLAVQTIGEPGSRDEQFYVVAVGGKGAPTETRYSVQEVLMLADWYRTRQKERDGE